MDLNDHQLNIINVLMFLPSAKYSELNEEKLPGNQFSYHLKYLTDNDFVKKNDDKYQLTLKGKELAGKIDIFSKKIEKQGKICVLPVCKKIENGVEKYLIHKRKKQPCFGYYGIPSGKAKYSELLAEEVLRELEEETGLTGDPVLKRVMHVLVKNEDEETIDDKLFMIFLIENLHGDFLQTTIEGDNFWMTIDEVKNLDLFFPDVLESINCVQSENISFVERIDKYEI